MSGSSGISHNRDHGEHCSLEVDTLLLGAWRAFPSDVACRRLNAGAAARAKRLAPALHGDDVRRARFEARHVEAAALVDRPQQRGCAKSALGSRAPGGDAVLQRGGRPREAGCV